MDYNKNSTGSYRIEDIYQGGPNSVDPNMTTYTGGPRPSASNVGAPGGAQTANQLQEVSQRLNEGVVPVEVTGVNPETFDQIPKQHFKEINRMAKLTGGKMSVHAPIVEPSGMGQEGWSESNRELAERQLKDAIDKSMEVSDKERVPITIHASALGGGSEYQHKKGGGREANKIVAVDQETGKMVPIEREEKYYPTKAAKRYKETGGKKASETIDPKEEINTLNSSQWDQELSQIIHYKEEADRILNQNMPQIKSIYPQIRKKAEEKGEIEQKDLTPEQQRVLKELQNVETYFSDSQKQIQGAFNKAYKYGSEEDRKKLLKASEQFREELSGDPEQQSSAIQNMISALKDVEEPKLYEPIEDFGKEHSAKTFGNVAVDAYKKAKKKNKKVPMVNIENLPGGMPFSHSDDLDQLLQNSRRQFINKATKPKSEGGLGLSESKAEKEAERVLGVTMDVGHMNVLKKQGLTDKDLKKETEKMAKEAKHVHLTDNFGHSDSHLPPGMGNVPTREIMEELEKQGYSGRHIVEAPAFVQHFQESPMKYSFEGLGSPIYSMEMQPYWNQTAGFTGGYYGGMGMSLPQTNVYQFGAGFSQLPSELGGSQPGAQGGRLSGNPME